MILVLLARALAPGLGWKLVLWPVLVQWMRHLQCLPGDQETLNLSGACHLNGSATSIVASRAMCSFTISKRSISGFIVKVSGRFWPWPFTYKINLPKNGVLGMHEKLIESWENKFPWCMISQKLKFLIENYVVNEVSNNYMKHWNSLNFLYRVEI